MPFLSCRFLHAFFLPASCLFKSIGTRKVKQVQRGVQRGHLWVLKGFLLPGLQLRADMVSAKQYVPITIRLAIETWHSPSFMHEDRH